MNYFNNTNYSQNLLSNPISKEELELIMEKKLKRIKKKIMKKREVHIKYIGEEKNKYFNIKFNFNFII